MTIELDPKESIGFGQLEKEKEEGHLRQRFNNSIKYIPGRFAAEGGCSNGCRSGYKWY